jgi:hypothetical protein
MKSTKLIYLLPLVLFMAISVPAFSSSIISNPSDSTSLVLRSEQILIRLKEIKEMDKSDLSRTEKKNLRKEVKSMKKEMKAMNGGVYLSVAAIIIIILVLILIL